MEFFWRRECIRDIEKNPWSKQTGHFTSSSYVCWGSSCTSYGVLTAACCFLPETDKLARGVLISSRLTRNGTGNWCFFASLHPLVCFLEKKDSRTDFFHVCCLWIRDNFVILQAIIAAMVFYMCPSFETRTLWNKNGLTAALALHVAISEPLFYTLHRCFHGDYFFKNYHSLHHSSPVPQPLTGNWKGFHKN